MSLPTFAQSTSPSVSARQELSDVIAKHEYPKAERLLIESLEADPSALDLLPVLGGVFFLDAKYLNCASALEKANVAGRLNNESRFTLVMAYVNLNRLDLARPELQILIGNAPGNSLYHYWLGRLDFIEQRFESGIENLNLAVLLDSHSARAYDLLGLCYEALAQSEKALSAFHLAVKWNREGPHPSPWPPFDLGEQLYRLGRLDQAETFFQEALSCEPAFAKAHFQLGLLHEKLGHNGAAIKELRTAVSLDNHFPEPYYALARILKKQGDPTSAQDAAKRFESLSKQGNGAR